MSIKLDHEYLLEDVMEYDYTTAEDHIITYGMKFREGWKETLDKITKDLVHLSTAITNHDITPEIIDISTLKNDVQNLQALLLTQINTIEMADNEQCLFFDLPKSIEPVKIPTFSGTFSTDFKAFEKLFNEAAKVNKVSKTDQPGVLKSALRGNQRSIFIWTQKH